MIGSARTAAAISASSSMVSPMLASSSGAPSTWRSTRRPASSAPKSKESAPSTAASASRELSQWASSSSSRRTTSRDRSRPTAQRPASPRRSPGPRVHSCASTAARASGTPAPANRAPSGTGDPDALTTTSFPTAATPVNALGGGGGGGGFQDRQRAIVRCAAPNPDVRLQLPIAARPTRQPVPVKVRAAVWTAYAASSSRPSRSSHAGDTPSSCGFMPRNHARTAALKPRSASRAATRRAWRSRFITPAAGIPFAVGPLPHGAGLLHRAGVGPGCRRHGPGRAGRTRRAQECSEARNARRDGWPRS